MTKRETFAVAMTMLGETFGRALTDPMLDGYWLALEELTEAELKSAVRVAVTTQKFMPSPAELLAFAGHGKIQASAIAEAWEAVRTAIDCHDYTASVDFGPLVNAVVRNLGGWDRLCRLDLEALNVWARKEFERIYEAFASKDVGMLNGAPHRGAFHGPPIRISIGGKLPPKQIEAPTNGVASALRGLAEEKSAR